jgi:lysophospholipase L1-like esterase
LGVGAVAMARSNWNAGRMSGARRFLSLCFIAVVGGAVVGPWASSHPLTTAAQPFRIVALGDSDTTGAGDTSGLGWVGRYAKLLRERRGLDVVVANLAEEGKTSADLLSEVRSDSTTRGALKTAQVVLIGIGGADLNKGDDRLEAGACKGTACYTADLRAFGRNIDATAGLVRKLRSPNRAVLRAISLPNVVPGAKDVIPPFVTLRIGVYENTTLKRYICGAMAKHAGRCVDAYRAFNGADGTENAYARGWLTKNPCCYPSGKGQQLMAELVFRSGLAPLH